MSTPDLRTDANGLQRITAIARPGYGVASGQGADSPYPQGSIVMQRPFFAALGLDLSACFAGTLNLDIRPYRFAIAQPDYTFRQVRWCDLVPPEDFSFVRCRVSHATQAVSGWIYYPHPETKPAHVQPDSTLEVLAPWLTAATPGSRLSLEVAARAIAFSPIPD